ncbi:MAG: hypothetical protein ACM3O9_03725 [Methylocystaceae bacterium]
MKKEFVDAWHQYWNSVPADPQAEIEYYYLAPIKHCLGKMPSEELTDKDYSKVTFIWYREFRMVIGTGVHKWAYIYKTDNKGETTINCNNNSVINAPNVHDYEDTHRGEALPFEFIGQCKNLIELDMLNNYLLDKLVSALNLDEQCNLFNHFPLLEKLNDRDSSFYPSRMKNKQYVIALRKEQETANMIVRNKKDDAVRLAKEIMQLNDYEYSNIIIYEVDRDTDCAMRVWQWIADAS